MTLRVVAFPMGYIVLAKGAQQIFFWTEVAATVVHVGLGVAAREAFRCRWCWSRFFRAVCVACAADLCNCPSAHRLPLVVDELPIRM